MTSAAPQVGGEHVRPVEPLHAAHHGHPALYPDVRAHALQLRHMAVAALENILHKYRGAPAPQQRRHQDSLTIGGEPRIGRGAHRRHRLQPPLAAQPYVLLAAVQPASRLL